MQAHAEQSYPNECCGLLGGMVDLFVDYYPLTNHAEAPKKNFFAAPEEMFQAMRQMRAGGQQQLGIYHSHPESSAYPSAKDVELGSGLGSFADSLENAVSFSYKEIPYLPESTVEGHSGRLVIGLCEGVPIAVMAGRSHYYEGYSLEEVVLPIRIAGLGGIKNMIITNAAGGLNPDFLPGDLMIIDDHINMLGVNPLRGPNDLRFGPRFPDMT